jgi:O-antigen/teichoic acid export membrane protein
VRQAAVLQAGAFAALGVNFLLSILLARLLGREAYGAYALVVSAFTTISLLKRMGQDYVATTGLAGALARGDGAAARQSLARFNAVNLWSTLAVIPPALIMAPWIMERFFGQPGLGQSLRLALLPPIWAPLLATLVVTLQCTRRLVTLTVVENASSLLVAAAGLGHAALALRQAEALDLASDRLVEQVLIGQAVASLAVAIVAGLLYQRRAVESALLPSLRWLASTVARAKPHLDHEVRAGLAVALDKNLVSLYPLAPILLLGAMASTDDVGLLRVAMSYAAVPLLALGAISRLLMVKLPELAATQPERVRRFFLQVTGTGGVLSIALTLPFALLAPWLIHLLYGDQFAPAARLVPFLALDPLLAGFGIAAGPIFRTYGRNLWAVWANLGVLLIGLPLAVQAVQHWGLEAAALSYALLVTAVRGGAYLLCLRIVSTAR